MGLNQRLGLNYVKCTCYEACKNLGHYLGYTSDYLKGIKYKCGECSKRYKYGKSFQIHKSQHEISHCLVNRDKLIILTAGVTIFYYSNVRPIWPNKMEI